MTDRFNESEYVASFLESLSSSVELTRYRLPWLTEEGKLGYDMKIMTKPGIPVLFQFKIPNRIENNTSSNISGFDYCIFFRQIDNFRQHRMLLQSLQNTSPCCAYYSAPKFDTWEDLMFGKEAKNVHFNSAFFCVTEIGPINNDMKKICYDINNNNAAIFPLHRTIQLHGFTDVARLADIELNIHRNPFWQTIDKVLNGLMNVFPHRIPVKVTRTSKKPRQRPRSPFYTEFLQLVTTQIETKTCIVNDFNPKDGLDYSDKLSHMFEVLYKELNVILVVYQPE